MASNIIVMYGYMEYYPPVEVCNTLEMNGYKNLFISFGNIHDLILNKNVTRQHFEKLNDFFKIEENFINFLKKERFDFIFLDYYTEYLAKFFEEVNNNQSEVFYTLYELPGYKHNTYDYNVFHMHGTTCKQITQKYIRDKKIKFLLL